MSRKQDNRTLAEAWDDVQHQHRTGRPIPARLPTVLEPRRIKLWPEVFQHRRPSKVSSAAHVRTLAAAAKESMLEPVKVWWDGKHWACIDGHHRLEAYKSAGVTYEVPVEVFQGDPEQAMLEAAARNSKDKLAMGHSEKLNTAWRLVTATGASKSETARASGASQRTVAYMRRVRDQLKARGKAPAEMNWREARANAAGEEAAAEVDWERRTEQEAQEIANKLVKALGMRASTRVEALGRALEIYSARLPEQLMEWWGAIEPQDDLV